MGEGDLIFMRSLETIPCVSGLHPNSTFRKAQIIVKLGWFLELFDKCTSKS